MPITDIRINVSFNGHRKRKKLIKVLGPGATDYILDLWISTAQNHPNGKLTGMDALDIALEANWDGDAMEFLHALKECKFIDTVNGEMELHDWDEHQPWVVGAPARSAKARKAALVRYGMPDESSEDATSMQQASGEDATSMQQASGEDATSVQQADSEDTTSTAPSPKPSPSPSPKETPPAGGPPIGGSNHFKERVGSHFESILESCNLIKSYPHPPKAAQKKPYNPFEHVQHCCNAGKHPGAIQEMMAGLSKRHIWDGIDTHPYAYGNYIMKTVNGNWNEKDAVAIHEEMKSWDAVDVSKLTFGILKQI